MNQQYKRSAKWLLWGILESDSDLEWTRVFLLLSA